MKKNFQIEVCMFGEFDILINGKSLLSNLTRLPVIIELLQYMVANCNVELLPSKIVEDIWPDREYLDTNKALRTYIYRLKKFLAGDNILGENISQHIMITNARGRYKLVISEQCSFDIWDFENIYKKTSAGVECAEDGKKIERIVEIYKGDFLQNTLYTHWSIPIRNMYLDQFCDINKCVTEFYYNEKLFKSAIKYCEQVFEIYDLDEEVNIYFLKSLIEEERVGSAFQHYTYITAKMYNELNIKPSRELLEVYNILKNPVEALNIKEEEPEEDEASIVHSLLLKQIPRTIKGYKLNNNKHKAVIGMFNITPKKTATNEELLEVMDKIKSCLDIILLKNYNFTVFGNNVMIFYIRDEKENFIKFVTEQINNFIKLNFENNYFVEFQINIMPPRKKNDDVIVGDCVEM